MKLSTPVCCGLAAPTLYLHFEKIVPQFVLLAQDT